MGGKSSAPAAPDYIGQANAQAAGNLEAARSQTQANRMDQITPYGTIKYTNGQTFDQTGYDNALKQYQEQLAQYNNAVAQRAANPEQVPYRADPSNPMSQFGGPSSAGDMGYSGRPEDMMVTGNRGPAPVAPSEVSRDAFYQGDPDKWSSEIILSDTGRQLLDQQNRTSLGLGALQDTAMDRVRDVQSQPFDTSGLININDQTGMDAWTKASQLIKDRNAGSLNAQQAALDTKLANMGLTAGSEGWGIQQGQFGKQRNDADMAAELAGAQVQNQMFNQALQGNNSTLQQRAFLRQMPLNELNALRTGSQVQNPTFSTPGQQGQTSGPDLLGATNSQYQAQVGNVNAQNAATASTNQAAAGVATAALAAFF